MPYGDWRDRLFSIVGEKIDDAARARLESFAVQLREGVVKMVSAGLSDAVVRHAAVPTVRNAYMIFLRVTGIPFQPPTPELFEDVIDAILFELRAADRGAR